MGRVRARDTGGTPARGHRGRGTADILCVRPVASSASLLRGPSEVVLRGRSDSSWSYCSWQSGSAGRDGWGPMRRPVGAPGSAGAVGQVAGRRRAGHRCDHLPAPIQPGSTNRRVAVTRAQADPVTQTWSQRRPLRGCPSFATIRCRCWAALVVVGVVSRIQVAGVDTQQ